ncbi:integral membrane [Fusarium albosuccineum]|uniref:Integral membrane n=1 Tax=Fusarium albosuccineum TaxID=1237068 RepID=A0A8H4PH11_9HYPO|nr:integral membrane [Fusarium albosuccineum]
MARVSVFLRAVLCFYAFGGSASAAYLQWQSCSDASPFNSTFNGAPRLSVGVVNEFQTWPTVQLNFSFWTTPADCVRAASMISSAEVKLDLLSGSSVYQLPANGSCRRFTSPDGVSGSVLDIPIAIDQIEYIPALATMGLEIRLFDDIYADARICQSTVATLALGNAITTAIRASVWTVFITVSIVGLLRTIWGNNMSDTDPDHKPRARTVLPEVTDCLQHLQFIFLTGCLSIHYPGFYQPIVGQLHWLSLFSNGDIDREPSYIGVRDGVYETNGTLTDKPGLELKSQVIGGSHQLMSTWLNMVLFIIIIVLASALGLQVYDAITRCQNPDKKQLKLLQILATLRWLRRRLTMLRLGVFKFDTSQRYRRISTPGGFEGHDRRCVQILVTLMCIRAATIGGLQVSGVSQLAILITCDVCLLLCIICLRSFDVVSILTVSTSARLCSLLLMTTFSRHLELSDSSRHIIGLTILAIQSPVLALFLISSLYHAIRLILRGRSLPGQVYGLRDLRRRKSQYLGPDTIQPPTPSEQPSNSSRSLKLDAANNPSPTDLGSFFRQPRSPSSCYPEKNASSCGDPVAVTSPTTTETSYPVSKRQLKVSVPPTIGGDAQDAPPSPSTNRTKLEGPFSMVSTKPLGPKWNDYSFREADMFYRRALLKQDSGDTHKSFEGNAHRPFRFSNLLVWARMLRQSNTAELAPKWFEVKRPRRDPRSLQNEQ